ncbi:MAG: RNA polymerase sigma factor [Solirubrobacteraceae bacterium]
MEVSALKQNALPGLRGPSPLLRLQSDERLIALVRRGQHAAFETLVARYQSRLLAFCRHMLSSKEDAEDVLQEVFAAAFNAILADERDIHVRPWLYRIARNRSLNHLRRATAVGVDSMDVHYAEGGISTGEKVLKRESFRQLLADVQELPETQRTALLLREIDALSYEQIAEAMETTIPSVKSLLVRARISLAEAAEARKLNCAEVRERLGAAAEGIGKVDAPARRHLRSCERCRAFRKQLKANNVALAMTLPVSGLLMLRRLATSKLGAGASAGHVAGAGAGAAAGGTAATSGFATAGASAIAGKAVAGLAAAALVTAGAVEAEHAASPPAHHSRPPVAAVVPSEPAAPSVLAATPQRSSTVHSTPAAPNAHQAAVKSSGKASAHREAVAKKASTKEATTSMTTTSTTTTSTTASATTGEAETAKKKTAPTSEPTVTEAVSETTQLPPASASTQATQPPIPAGSGTTTTAPTPPATTTTAPPATTTSESPTTATSTSTTATETSAEEASTSTSTSEAQTTETQTTTTVTSSGATGETGGAASPESTTTVATTP